MNDIALNVADPVQKSTLETIKTYNGKTFTFYANIFLI